MVQLRVVEMEFAAVVRTAREIARRLDDLGVPYLITGGLAVYQHGYRRTTDDVDLIVTAAGLAEIHAKLIGLGYRPVHPTSKAIRDTDTRTKIDFLIAGTYPGDGKPKPVVFPDPAKPGLVAEGLRFVSTEELVEQKLSCVLTTPHREHRDAADVQEIIRQRSLPREFAQRLDPWVRAKFLELWELAALTPPEEGD